MFSAQTASVEAAPISHGRGPRRREGAFIVDRELELQVRAPVVWRWLGAPILFCVPFPSFFRGFVIDEPISFDNMQGFRVRRAVPADRRKGADLDSHGVYDQRVPFVMAYGIAKPGRGHMRGMRF